MKKILAAPGPVVSSSKEPSLLFKSLLVGAGLSVGIAAATILFKYFGSETTSLEPLEADAVPSDTVSSTELVSHSTEALSRCASHLFSSIDNIANIALGVVMLPVAQAHPLPNLGAALDEVTLDTDGTLPETVNLSDILDTILESRGVTQKQFQDLFKGKPVEKIMNDILDLIGAFINIDVFNLPFDVLAAILELKPAGILSAPIPKTYLPVIQKFSGKSFGSYKITSIEGELYLSGYKSTIAKALKCKKKDIQKTLNKLNENPQRRTRIFGKLSGIKGLNNRLYSASRTQSTYSGYALDFIRLTNKHTKTDALNNHLRKMANVFSNKAMVINDKTIVMFNKKGQLDPDFLYIVENIFLSRIDDLKQALLDMAEGALSKKQESILTTLLDNMVRFFRAQEKVSVLEGGGSSRLCAESCSELAVHQAAEDVINVLNDISVTHVLGVGVRLEL
jgi:hypothetical protein